MRQGAHSVLLRTTGQYPAVRLATSVHRRCSRAHLTHQCSVTTTLADSRLHIANDGDPAAHSAHAWLAQDKTVTEQHAVHALLLSSLLILSHEDTAKICNEVPQLNSCSRHDVMQQVSMLQETLQLTQSELSAVVNRAPVLLISQRDDVQRNIECIASTLKWNRLAVQKAICAHPHFLLQDGVSLRAQLSTFLAHLGAKKVSAYTSGQVDDLLNRYTSLDVAWLAKFTSVSGVTHRNAQQLIDKVPRLLSSCPNATQGKLAALSTAIGLDASCVVTMVCDNPSLLRLSQSDAATNLQMLASLLKLSPGECTKLVTRLPSLLAMKHQALYSKLANLQSALELPMLKVVDLVVKTPCLLHYTQYNISRKVDSLVASLQQPRGKIGRMVLRDPSLLTMTPRTLDARMAGLASALQLEVVDVQAMVSKQPVVLTRLHSSRSVMLKLKAVANSLGVSMTVARALVIRVPTLLLHCPDTLAEKLSRLVSDLEIPADRAVAMVVANPTLLNYNTNVLRERWLLLRMHAARNARWQQQLDAYAPSSLAVMLTKGSYAYTRLEYLAATSAQQSISLSSALLFPLEKFQKQFPDYDDCLATTSS